MKFTNSAAVVLGAIVLATTACGDKAGEGAMGDSATMSAGASTGAMAGGSTAAMGDGTTPAAGGMTDANIVYTLDQAHVADSSLGALAEKMGTNADVKSYGKMMQGEHHGMRQQGMDLATKLGVTPAAPAGDQSATTAQQTMSSMMNMAKGKEWDKAYIDHEVNYHTQVLQTATAALGMAQNQELKDLISKAAPIVQKHLDRAKELQSKMSAM